MTENIATKQINELVSISRILILVVLVIHLSGCGGHVYHVVESGETLYSIGWLYGYDHRQIAKWNNLSSRNSIRKGQRLRVAPPPGVNRSGGRSTTLARKSSNTGSVTAKPARSNGITKTTKAAKNRKRITGNVTGKAGRNSSADEILSWNWPVKNGKPIQMFDARDPGRRGLDFTGRAGQPVYSAAAGHIVYSGAGLPAYGKLIIVKHNDEYLSAYAHNDRLLVKEGEDIRSGQHIADMGRNGANKVMLHFEIRRNGKPVDPLMFLPDR